MKIFYLFLVLAITTAVTAQDYDKGYYIDASGRHDVYFKKRDFFNYKSLKAATSPEGEYTWIDPEGITEYGIDNDIKFQKFTVSIDHSKLTGSDVSTVKELQYVTEAVFLKVLLEGDASLYVYLSDEGDKYFYAVKSKSIKVTQLMYKRYMAKEHQIGENNYFRQQLFNDVKCTGQAMTAFATIRYGKNELQKVFEHYNQCNGGATVVFESKKSAVKFKYTVFAGAGNTRFSLDNGPSGLHDISKITPGVGAEIAMLLPKENWAFFIRADYDGIKGSMQRTETTAYNTTTDSYDFNVHFYNIYIGSRYNFKLTPKSKLFVDASYAVTLPSGSFVYNRTSIPLEGGPTYFFGPYTYDVNSCAFLNFGLGYTCNNKYGADLRINTNKPFLEDPNFALRANFIRIGLNLRYTIN